MLHHALCAYGIPSSVTWRLCCCTAFQFQPSKLVVRWGGHEVIEGQRRAALALNGQPDSGVRHMWPSDGAILIHGLRSGSVGVATPQQRGQSVLVCAGVRGSRGRPPRAAVVSATASPRRRNDPLLLPPLSAFSGRACEQINRSLSVQLNARDAEARLAAVAPQRCEQLLACQLH